MPVEKQQLFTLFCSFINVDITRMHIDILEGALKARVWMVTLV